MSDPSPYVLASVPSASSDPRLLTLHLEICRMRAELENLETRIERIRVSEVEAASDTRPFVDRAQELVDRTVAALLEAGRAEIALTATEGRVRAAARLEAANHEAQELLASAREELAAVLTARAESVGDLTDLPESDRSVLRDDGLELVTDVTATALVDPMPAGTEREQAGPEMVAHEVELEEFPGWDAGFGLAAPPASPEAPDQTEAPAVVEGATDVVEVEPIEVAPTEVAAPIEQVAPIDEDVVPTGQVAPVDEAPSGNGDRWPEVHEHAAPDPVTTNRYDELWGIAAGVGVDDPATPTPAPTTVEGGIEEAVGLDQGVAASDAFGSETWAPVELPTEPPAQGLAAALAAAAATADTDPPAPAPADTSAPEASATDAPAAEPVSAERPATDVATAAPAEQYPPPAADYPPPATRTVGTETARADAAFDVWLAMNPKSATPVADLPVQPERARARWIRPVEIVLALLLVIAAVIVILLFVG